MTLRIGIYTRLSHDATGEQTATARQEKACRAFAEVRGWDVVEVFEDVDLSAYQRSVVRPSYERLLEAIADRRVDGALVWKLDRLVRRPAEFERFWAACEQVGAVVVSATEPIDASTDLGVALVRILVTFAHLESATISVRMKAKQKEMAEAGRALNGRAPYGWRHGMTELEPAEAEVIRDVTRRFLAGDSMTKIAADLYAEGVRSRSGKAFNQGAVHRLMTGAHLVGDRTYHGTVVAQDCYPAVLDRDT